MNSDKTNGVNEESNMVFEVYIDKDTLTCSWYISFTKHPVYYFKESES